MTTKPQAAEPQSALGFSLQFDLGAGRTCTMQTFLPQDVPVRELNLMLDKMTAAGDRQRAHYQLEKLHRELAQEEKVLAQHEADLVDVGARHQAEQEKRQAEFDKNLKAISTYEAAYVDAQRERGVRGPVELRGKDKANVDRLTFANDKIKAEMDAANAQRDVTVANSAKTIARQRELIAKMKAEIAECEAVWDAGLKE